MLRVYVIRPMILEQAIYKLVNSYPNCMLLESSKWGLSSYRLKISLLPIVININFACWKSSFSYNFLPLPSFRQGSAVWSFLFYRNIHDLLKKKICSNSFINNSVLNEKRSDIINSLDSLNQRQGTTSLELKLMTIDEWQAANHRL